MYVRGIIHRNHVLRMYQYVCIYECTVVCKYHTWTCTIRIIWYVSHLGGVGSVVWLASYKPRWSYRVVYGVRIICTTHTFRPPFAPFPPLAHTASVSTTTRTQRQWAITNSRVSLFYKASHIYIRTIPSVKDFHGRCMYQIRNMHLYSIYHTS